LFSIGGSATVFLQISLTPYRSLSSSVAVDWQQRGDFFANQPDPLSLLFFFGRQEPYNQKSKADKDYVKPKRCPREYDFVDPNSDECKNDQRESHIYSLLHSHSAKRAFMALGTNASVVTG
jgi:hypothetical protein